MNIVLKKIIIAFIPFSRLIRHCLIHKGEEDHEHLLPRVMVDHC
jgi:hypothetical protein